VVEVDGGGDGVLGAEERGADVENDTDGFNCMARDRAAVRRAVDGDTASEAEIEMEDEDAAHAPAADAVAGLKRHSMMLMVCCTMECLL